MDIETDKALEQTKSEINENEQNDEIFDQNNFNFEHERTSYDLAINTLKSELEVESNRCELIMADLRASQKYIEKLEKGEKHLNGIIHNLQQENLYLQ